MTSAPMVSVIIPTYNRAHLIERTLRSVLSQTYPEIEIVVVDDGSVDDTRNVVEKIDGNIRYIYQQNAGAAHARNAGFQASHGEFINFLDSDDWFLANKLAVQAAFLKENQQIDLVFCGWRDLDDKGNILDEVSTFAVDDFLRITLLNGNEGFLPPHSPLLRRTCIEKYGLFDESMRMREEQDFWIRLALAGCKFGLVQQVLCVYESRTDGKGKNWDALQSRMEIILGRVFSSATLPAEIAAMKSEIYARSYLSFAAYHARRKDESDDCRIKNVKKYTVKAFAGNQNIQKWRTDTFNPLLYYALEMDPDEPGETFLSMLPIEQLGESKVDYLLGRLYSIQFWQAFSARNRVGAIRSLVKTTRYSPKNLLENGMLAAMARSMLGMYPGNL